MVQTSVMTVEEVAQELRISKSKAYQIVREMNAELQKQGYLTIAGRVNTTFFHKKVCYCEEQ
jgi:predicted transcriptional regulator